MHSSLQWLQSRRRYCQLLLRRAFNACVLMWRPVISMLGKPCGSESSFHLAHLGPNASQLSEYGKTLTPSRHHFRSLYNAQILQPDTASHKFCVCMLPAWVLA